MERMVNELKEYYDNIKHLNEDGFIKVKAGYLVSFLTEGPSVYLITYDARIFKRFEERFFREELHVLDQDGEVPKNYVELDEAPHRVLEKMKEIKMELAIALGLFY
ncbi:MAG: hypothetical protein ACLFVI_02745 [Archaeoglobaceae archaeon]